jgi:hypothetical protein
MSSNILSTHTDIAIASDACFRMSGQNRIRYKNSMAVASRTTAQVISNETFTVIAYNATDILDTDALHDTSTNNSRIVAAIAGKYFVFSYVNYELEGTGIRFLDIEKNSSGTQTNGNIVAAQLITANGDAFSHLGVSGIVALSAGDHIESFVYQNSGGELDICSGGTIGIKMGMVYIGE